MYCGAKMREAVLTQCYYYLVFLKVAVKCKAI